MECKHCEGLKLEDWQEYIDCETCKTRHYNFDLIKQRYSEGKYD